MNDSKLILKKLDELIQTGNTVANSKLTNTYLPDMISSIPFFSWTAEVLQFFNDNFESNLSYRSLFLNKVVKATNYNPPSKYHAVFGVNILQKLKKYVIENPRNYEHEKTDVIEQLIQIFKNFHRVAVQLAKRKHGRPPYIIENEYDVQDLLYAFLSILFDDVRREEWTPSYCGSSKRVDFLLKKEKIIIESKIASETHNAKDIGDELLIDIAHYKEISFCDVLICVIYDPGCHIENPLGFTTDIEKNSSNNFLVSVDIIPKL